MAIMRRRKTKISATRDRPAVARVEAEGEGMVEKVSRRENAMQEGVIVPPLTQPLPTCELVVVQGSKEGGFKGNRNEQLIEVTTDQQAQRPYFDPSRVTFHYSRCGREPNQRLCATDCEAAPL